MIALGADGQYILAAYLGVAVLLAALIAYVIIDARHVARTLRRLDAEGIRRRSDGPRS